MNLEEVPIVMQLISFWRKAKAERVDSQILRVLRKQASASVPELSGYSGYSEKMIQSRVDALEISGVLRVVNGRVFIANGSTRRRGA